MRSGKPFGALRQVFFGEQHDAREMLEDILTHMGLGHALCDTPMVHQMRSDIVSLPAFESGGWWFVPALHIFGLRHYHGGHASIAPCWLPSII